MSLFTEITKVFKQFLGRSDGSQNSLFDILENQMEDNNPPETTEVLKALLEKGFDRETALDRMADVLEGEIFAMAQDKRDFDLPHYREALKSLV